MSNKTPYKYRILDFYLRAEILIDIILITVFIFLADYLKQKYSWNIKFDREFLKTLHGDLIATCISLIGFIVASLTILISMKESIKSRLDQTQKISSGLELFFSSDTYSVLIKKFNTGTFLLIIVFFLLCILKLGYNIATEYYSKILAFLLILIFSTVFRTFFLLVLVTRLQKQGKNSESSSSWY